MLIGGIDPGKKGYLSVISDNESIEPTFYKLPYDSDGELNTTLFSLAIEPLDIVFVETPIGKNTSGMLLRERDFGEIKGLIKLAKKRFVPVAPITWKSAFNLTSDKRKSIAMIQKRYPNIVLRFGRERNSNDNMAEALLIAIYGKGVLTAV